MSKEIITKWLQFYPEDKTVVSHMSDKEIKDAFSMHLSFGTAGIRGIIGPGTNRMNQETIKNITLGIVHYMEDNELFRVVIGYDGRLYSAEWAHLVSAIMMAHHREVFFMPMPLPTPVTSFAVRDYHADIGIMITASHNPKDYNGYKVFNAEGCQISKKVSDIIQEYINDINLFDTYEKTTPTPNFIHPHVIIRYVTASMNVMHEENWKSDIRILYTALHGVGAFTTTMMLDKLCNHVSYRLVESQIISDGTFPTCPLPNPELKGAWEEALKEATDEDAILATDPDADRVGLMIRDKGEYVFLSGNDMGALLLQYLCQTEDVAKKNKIAVRTFVTTSLLDKIATENGVVMHVTETGFKNICANIKEKTFLLGTEEAIGNLVSTHVRDKDALSAMVLFLEMISFYKAQGKTLIQVLEEIQNHYGPVHNLLISKENIEITDVITKILDGSSLPIIQRLYADNRVEILLEDNLKIILRKSGTEPKMKIYLESKNQNWQEQFEMIGKILE